MVSGRSMLVSMYIAHVDAR